MLFGSTDNSRQIQLLIHQVLVLQVNLFQLALSIPSQKVLPSSVPSRNSSAIFIFNFCAKKVQLHSIISFYQITIIRSVLRNLIPKVSSAGLIVKFTFSIMQTNSIKLYRVIDSFLIILFHESLYTKLHYSI